MEIAKTLGSQPESRLRDHHPHAMGCQAHQVAIGVANTCRGRWHPEHIRLRKLELGHEYLNRSNPSTSPPYSSLLNKYKLREAQELRALLEQGIHHRSHLQRSQLAIRPCRDLSLRHFLVPKPTSEELALKLERRQDAKITTMVAHHCPICKELVWYAKVILSH